MVWAIVCNMSSIPGVEAYVVETFSCQEDARERLEMANWPTSYWVQKVPHAGAQLMESTGEWE